MEIIYGLIYILICTLIAYYIGINKRIGFGYSFLFCFIFTPIIGTIITFLVEKIKPNKTYDRILIILGNLIIYPSLIFSILLLFFFYNENKPQENISKIPDSIRIKNSFNGENIKKVIYHNGILLAELKSGKYEIIKDSVIYKSYLTTSEINKSNQKIRFIYNEIKKLEDEIKSENDNKLKTTAKINKYNSLIADYNDEVKKVDLLTKQFELKFKSYKIENPTFWYFSSNRFFVKIFFALLFLSLFGKFLLDLGKRKI